MRWRDLSTATRIATLGRKRPTWQRLLGAFVLTALVVLGRMALDPWLGRQHNRHLVFLPTVMIAAWLWGFGPGLLSAALSTVAMALWWMPHPRVLDLGHADLGLFMLVSVAICGLIESLQVARARADQASEAHEQVLAIVAHDLRNPLSSIRMTLDKLRHGPDDAEARARRLATIDRATLRMDHLIRDLVDSTRIEQGALTLNRREESAGAILREAGELFAPLAQERGVTLEVTDATEGETIDCDRGRVLQVLQNLLGNALKFTPRGGRITASAVRGPRAVRFQVDDTGPGIAPGDLPHVFERYWRTDSGGTGLGLFITENIVRAHGGTVAASSRPGCGACFLFDIPSAPAGLPP